MIKNKLQRFKNSIMNKIIHTEDIVHIDKSLTWSPIPTLTITSKDCGHFDLARCIDGDYTDFAFAKDQKLPQGLRRISFLGQLYFEEVPAGMYKISIIAIDNKDREYPTSFELHVEDKVDE